MRGGFVKHYKVVVGKKGIFPRKFNVRHQPKPMPIKCDTFSREAKARKRENIKMLFSGALHWFFLSSPFATYFSLFCTHHDDGFRRFFIIFPFFVVCQWKLVIDSCEKREAFSKGEMENIVKRTLFFRKYLKKTKKKKEIEGKSINYFLVLLSTRQSVKCKQETRKEEESAWASNKTMSRKKSTKILVGGERKFSRKNIKAKRASAWEWGGGIRGGEGTKEEK